MRNYLTSGKRGCVAIGTGLVALDVVINGRSSSPIGVWAGGTCGNVLTILSFLGWKSFPVARLSNDLFAEMLTGDLEKWKVKTDFVEKAESGSTPIIVQRIKKGKEGFPKHSFGWNCPSCGARLPAYKAVLSESANAIADHLPLSEVFFFDRVSRGAIELAKQCHDDGAIVCFEPTSARNESQFFECLEIADIVKYSHDYADRIPTIPASANVFLEIETRGNAGLRFRNLEKGERRNWEFLDSFEFDEYVDAAGSGDWLTAGLLHLLSQSGRGGLRRSGTDRLRNALSIAQGLAALNCQFEGARGMMYALTLSQVQVALHELVDELLILDPTDYLENAFEVDESKCPACSV